MNKRLSIVVLGVLAALAGTSVGYGAIINLQSGSLGFLNGVTQVNVEYSYEGMRVGQFAREQDYIDKKVAEFNQKEAGKGELWRQGWVDARARSLALSAGHDQASVRKARDQLPSGQGSELHSAGGASVPGGVFHEEPIVPVHGRGRNHHADVARQMTNSK